MSGSEQRRCEIVNIKGLHARASAKLADLCARFDASAELSTGGNTASGDSIMGLLMLAASKGTIIEIETRGNEARELADAIVALVADRFGEGD